jgi:hypothetical protein
LHVTHYTTQCEERGRRRKRNVAYGFAVREPETRKKRRTPKHRKQNEKRGQLAPREAASSDTQLLIHGKRALEEKREKKKHTCNYLQVNVMVKQ